MRTKMVVSVSTFLVFLILVTALPIKSYGQTPSPAPTGTAGATAEPTTTVATTPEATPTPATGDRHFPETGFTVPAVFLTFWEAHGGLPVFGYPISEARSEQNLNDKKEYLVQYFERNRFEYHPEFEASGNGVLLGLLGVELTRTRSFPTVDVFADTSDKVYLDATKHSLAEPFLSYWRDNGGLAVFGYAISEPFEEKSDSDGKIYTVQYFERNRFEYHPENQPQYQVLLGLLGQDVLAIQNTVTAWGTPVPGGQPVVVPIQKPAKPAVGTTFLKGPVAENGFNGQFFYQNRERLLNMVKDVNFGWITQQIEWKETETPKGVLYFEEIDRIVNDARQHNVRVLLSVVKAPSWETGGFNGFPKDPADLYDFMKALATHFKGRVDAYMVYNEPNLSGESGDVNPSRYVEVLKQGYLGVKAGDPNAIVLSGALAPTGVNDPEGKRGPGELGVLSDLRYLEEMYQYNNGEVRSYFDVLGIHPYGFNNPPELKWPDNPNNNPAFPLNDKGQIDYYNRSNSFYFRRIEEQRAIMEKYGDGAKQVWVTEYGWCSDFRPDGYGECKYNTEQDQGDYLVRAIQYSKKYYPWMGVMFIWNLNFSTFQEWYTGPSHFSIINGDWSGRPAYFALKNRPK
ncbi:MAG: hypothetical protein ABI670_05620 [Chloroflexota bacterium]